MGLRYLILIGKNFTTNMLIRIDKIIPATSSAGVNLPTIKIYIRNEDINAVIIFPNLSKV